MPPSPPRKAADGDNKSTLAINITNTSTRRSDDRESAIGNTNTVPLSREQHTHRRSKDAANAVAQEMWGGLARPTRWLYVPIAGWSSCTWRVGSETKSARCVGWCARCRRGAGAPSRSGERCAQRTPPACAARRSSAADDDRGRPACVASEYWRVPALRWCSARRPKALLVLALALAPLLRRQRGSRP